MDPDAECYRSYLLIAMERFSEEKRLILDADGPQFPIALALRWAQLVNQFEGILTRKFLRRLPPEVQGDSDISELAWWAAPPGKTPKGAFVDPPVGLDAAHRLKCGAHEQVEAIAGSISWPDEPEFSKQLWLARQASHVAALDDCDRYLTLAEAHGIRRYQTAPLRAWLEMASGRFSDAEKHVEWCEAVFPGSYTTHVVRAQLSEKQGDYGAAASHYAAAVGRNPLSGYASTSFIKVSMRLGRWRSSLRQYAAYANSLKQYRCDEDIVVERIVKDVALAGAKGLRS